MLTCADCKEVDCIQIGTDQNACDSFNGEYDVTTLDVYGDEVYTIKEAERDIKMLFGAIAMMRERVDDMERRANTIIAAIIKASGPEEER